jgi:hypothetical protein
MGVANEEYKEALNQSRALLQELQIALDGALGIPKAAKTSTDKVFHASI